MFHFQLTIITDMKVKKDVLRSHVRLFLMAGINPERRAILEFTKSMARQRSTAGFKNYRLDLLRELWEYERDAIPIRPGCHMGKVAKIAKELIDNKESYE